MAGSAEKEAGWRNSSGRLSHAIGNGPIDLMDQYLGLLKGGA
jgi:hypothetical protein